jgi:acyl-coenzyme A synthetase/AMP-(fatty) acid ligase
MDNRTPTIYEQQNQPMRTLWTAISRPEHAPEGALHGASKSVALSELVGSSCFEDLPSLRGRSVLIAVKSQLSAALALLELDGVARRMVLCTPDLSEAQLAEVAAIAEADTVIIDEGAAAPAGLLAMTTSTDLWALDTPRGAGEQTQWVLLTSGTTGLPKLVLHSLDSLAGALPQQSPDAARVWSTFYDMRRYGGLQIYLRAVLSGAPLVLSNAGESTHDFLSRAGAAGVTHISGTPSHWRKVLMSGETGLIDPEYVRLSGEIAEQTVLDSLRAAYPKARIAHAFASTEAGVAFDVNDGLAGFPAAFLQENPGNIELKVEDGTLWIRSARNAARYLGADAPALRHAAGFVDTGDLVELIEGRYHFRGRKGGVINVGGLKVYPEEVESVLNADPRVRMSLIKSKRNPITGAVLIAEVVLADPQTLESPVADAVKLELLEACRRHLAAHKVPALIRFVPGLQLTAAGKLVRPNA